VEVWTAEKTELGHWLFSWSGAPTDYFTVWLDGKQIDTVLGTEYDFALDGYTAAPPALEIVDDEDTPESNTYPPFAILQWRYIAGATAYLVEVYAGSAWTTQKTIRETGAGYYWFKTAVLADQTEAQYRISALDLRGNAGTPIAFTFDLVRNPAAPDVEYTIDGANDLVVSEA